MAKVYHNNLVQELDNAHQEITRLRHFAFSSEPDSIRETTAVTKFMYEFLIYNSLYSMNWSQTTEKQTIFLPSRGKGKLSEPDKQERFEDFLKYLATNDPTKFYSAFQAVIDVTIQDSWKIITPDSQITSQTGEEFFGNLIILQKKLQIALQTNQSNLDEIFTLIRNCRYYLYLIRNNVFHGSKSLGRIWDKDQQKRLEVYYILLNGIITSFFALIRE